MSHNTEIKLCNLYQFTEAFSGIVSCKNLTIFHAPSFCNKLHLVDALFARTQTSFGVGQKSSASSLETFLSSR